MKPGRKFWRGTLALAGVLVAAGIAAPFVNANRFARQIRHSLQNALGREVEIGAVHFNLFNGPGFELEDVVIHEDPAISLEPFAYIQSLEARVSPRSLWTGRLEFSSLRLDEPSINLAKRSSADWNFEPLLVRTAGASPAAAPRLPALRIRGGRINFRFGDTKSVFYFTDPDVDISPPSSSDGEWQVRFSGQPARTDRPAVGFGRFTGRGRWKPDPRTGGAVEFFLNLDRSPIAELITLVHGHDIGVHGLVASRARLAGPISGIRITGTMDISDIHRWDLLPPHGSGWPLEYTGTLDLAGQRLELDGAPAGDHPPFAIRYRASEYLSNPRWSVVASIERLPAAPLVEVARHMGLDLPAGFSAEGDLSGTMGYSAENGVEGKLTAPELSLKTAESPAVRLAPVEIALERMHATLAPAALIFRTNGRAIVAGEYDWGTQSLSGGLETKGMQIADLQSGILPLLGASAPPVFGLCDSGLWRGEVRYQTQPGTPGEFTGAFEIANAGLTLPGMAIPLRVDSARIALKEGGTLVNRIRGSLGESDFSGEYRFRPAAVRPHHFQFSFQKLDAAAIESAFLPTLVRSESLLSRALRLGKPNVPAWLDERNAEGRVDIGALFVDGVELEKFRANLRWEAASLEFSDVEARVGSAVVKGRGSINLRRTAPAYRFTANWSALRWQGGLWSGDALLQAAGTGRDLMRSLRAEGTFHARSFQLDEETTLETVSGAWQFTAGARGPRVQFGKVEAAIGDALYKGKGSSGEGGRLSLELTDGRRQVRMGGTLSPFQLTYERPEP